MTFWETKRAKRISSNSKSYISHRCREVGSCDLDVFGYKVVQPAIAVHLGRPQVRQSEIRLPYPGLIRISPTSSALRLRAPVSHVSLLADALRLLFRCQICSPHISQRVWSFNDRPKSQVVMRIIPGGSDPKIRPFWTCQYSYSMPHTYWLDIQQGFPLWTH